MTIAAAIDIGSNSIHLLVASVEASGVLETLADENLQLGLGSVVEAQGRLGAAARRSAVAVVAGYATQARDMGAQQVLLMGTQPLRRAEDRSLLRRTIRDTCALDLVILGHEQEAGLTLVGVTGGRRIDVPLLVMDVGGGSSEVMLLTPGAAPVVGAFPVGSSRLSTAIVTHDPVTPAEVAELRARARSLADLVPVGLPQRAIVSGGSGTNVSRLLGRERTTDVMLSDLETGLGLLQSRAAGDLALATGLTERRVRQLAAGIALVEALMLRYRISRTQVSDAGLREGAVLLAVESGDGWLAGLPAFLGGPHDGAAGNQSDGA